VGVSGTFLHVEVVSQLLLAYTSIFEKPLEAVDNIIKDAKTKKELRSTTFLLPIVKYMRILILKDLTKNTRPILLQ